MDLVQLCRLVLHIIYVFYIFPDHSINVMMTMLSLWIRISFNGETHLCKREILLIGSPLVKKIRAFIVFSYVWVNFGILDTAYSLLMLNFVEPPNPIAVIDIDNCEV